MCASEYVRHQSNREIFTQLSGKWTVSNNIFTSTHDLYRGMYEEVENRRSTGDGFTACQLDSMLVRWNFKEGASNSSSEILKFKMTHAKPYR